MSLDVSLELDTPPTSPHSGSGIFVRRNGQTVEMTREEWDKAFPDQVPVVMTGEYVDCSVYESNITHNLNKMAEAAGIYNHLWRPDELGVKKAGELIAPLAAGLLLLRTDPERFKVFNPSNGWGDYDGLVRFVADYLEACTEYPDACVRVSR